MSSSTSFTQNSWGCDVSLSPSPSLDYEQLNRRIEAGHRRSLVSTIILSIATLVVAGGLLAFTGYEIKQANRQLGEVQGKITQANQANESAQSELKKTQDQLRAALAQVTDLQSQLDAAKKQLSDALDLSKHAYTLHWDDLKLLYVQNGNAGEVLVKIEQLRNNVKWGMANTPAGGYNSPGFAELVLKQLGRVPNGTSLANLPRDDGPPRAGDIVVYASGYSLFYFRDQNQKEFVVGMTPLGVLSLNYDFGIKRETVLHTGLTR